MSKEKIRQWIRGRRIPLIVSALIYFYTLFIFFNHFNFPETLDFSFLIRVIVIQIVFLCCDFGISLFLATFFRRVKAGNRFAKHLLRFFLVAIVINGIILILIWPGNWVNDEATVLFAAKNLQYYSWQNYLTVIYYTICMVVFPSPISIIIFQTLFISFVFAYFVTCLYEKYPSKLIYLLYLILLLPPVICNDFYPLRITVHTYLELLTLIWVYNNYRHAKKISWRDTIFLGFVFFLLAYWRSESIYYLGAPLIIFLFFRKRGQKNSQLLRKCLIIFAISFILVGGFSIYDKKISKSLAVKYQIAAYLNPLSTMLTNDEIQNNSKMEIETIDRFLDTKLLAKEAEYWNILVYLTHPEDLFFQDFESNANLISKNFLKIVLKNPQYFFENRFKVFAITNGDYVPGDSYFALNGLNYFDGNDAINFVNPNTLMTPIFPEIRSNLMVFLRGGAKGDLPTLKTWNVIPVLFLTISLALILFVRKYWLAGILVSSIVVRAILVFLTAPASLFMYYFPLYLEGSLFCLAVFLCTIITIRSKYYVKN